MDVKLRDYVIEEKMKVTSEEVRAFLYIFLMCPRRATSFGKETKISEPSS